MVKNLKNLKYKLISKKMLFDLIILDFIILVRNAEFIILKNFQNGY